MDRRKLSTDLQQHVHAGEELLQRTEHLVKEEYGVAKHKVEEGVNSARDYLEEYPHPDDDRMA
jgi:ElaB/YqjD/DUF883 family membrane-anchored ribosome-binding protein